MRAKLLIVFAAVAFATSALIGQSSAPIVVQAADTPVAPAPAAAPVAANQASVGTLKLLQDLKATNDAILAKQAATLQQLEELEKAANEIKIYSKRG